MRTLLLLLLQLVALLVPAAVARAQQPPWTSSTLPACCTDVHRTYDETVRVFSAALTEVACFDCGPELETLGVFGQLNYVAPNSDDDYNGQIAETPQVSLSCYNCTSLTSLGVFPVLPFFLSGVNLTVTCVDCPQLLNLAHFPNMSTVVAPDNGFFFSLQVNVTVLCQSCPVLPTLTDLTALTSYYGTIDDGLAGALNFITLSFACVDCASLAVAVDMAALVLIGPTGSLSVTCEQCPALTSGLSLPQASTLWLAQSGFSDVVVLNCTDCAALTTLVDAPVLGSLGRPPNDVGNSWLTQLYLVGLTCQGCPSLLTVANVPALEMVMPYYNLLLGVQWTIRCVSCPALTTVVSTTDAFTSFAGPSVLNIVVNWTCVDCPVLTSFISDPSSVQTIVGNSINPAAATASVVAMTCVNCGAIQSFGSWDSLSSLSTATGTTTPAVPRLMFSCQNCSSMAWPMCIPSFAQFDPQLTNIRVSCDNCATTFNATEPISYVFAGVLPTYLAEFSDESALSIRDVPGVVPLGFLRGLVPVQYLHRLEIINVAQLANLDALVNVVRVEHDVIITQNAALTNMDGLGASLSHTAAATVTDNPLLCNINTPMYRQIVSSNRVIISANGNTQQCSRLMPSRPVQPAVVARSTSTIALAWDTLQLQPSVRVQYSVQLNGVVVLTYQAFSPPAMPYSITGLSPDTTYVFVIAATINGNAALSLPLTTATYAGIVDVCPLGFVPTSNTVNTTTTAVTSSDGDCVQCGPGTFVSFNRLSCAQCVRGTASSMAGASGSSQCILCAKGYKATDVGLVSCSKCASSEYCPMGAASSLSQNPIAWLNSEIVGLASSQEMAVSADTVFILVFLCVGIAITIPLMTQRCRENKMIEVYVNHFAAVMRTPRWLMSVDLDARHEGNKHSLMEPLSYDRGIVGIWVVLGVLLSTTAQVYNFTQNEFSMVTSMQPGTTFYDGSPISEAVAFLNFSVTLIASPVSCSSEDFNVQLAIGDVSLSEWLCVDQPNGQTTFTYSVADRTLVDSTSSTAVVALTINSANGNNVFVPVVEYNITALMIDQSWLVVSEAIVKEDGSAVLTGATVVTLAGVAAEMLDASFHQLATGYSFSYIDTEGNFATEPQQSFSFQVNINVPSYYLRNGEVQVISLISFLSGLISIPGGVITVGTFLAFCYSYYVHYFMHDEENDQAGYEMSIFSRMSSSSTLISTPASPVLSRQSSNFSQTSMLPSSVHQPPRRGTVYSRVPSQSGESIRSFRSGDTSSFTTSPSGSQLSLQIPSTMLSNMDSMPSAISLTSTPISPLSRNFSIGTLTARLDSIRTSYATRTNSVASNMSSTSTAGPRDLDALLPDD